VGERESLSVEDFVQYLLNLKWLQLVLWISWVLLNEVLDRFEDFKTYSFFAF